MNVYDSKQKINTSFSPDFIPEEQLQTQWSELLQIKKVIRSLYIKKKKKLHILDIGVGTGRILKHLAFIPEIWDCIETYTGIDNNNNCLALAKKNIKQWQLQKKVSILKLEARDILSLQKNYDIIMTTWFTPGNFYPANFNFKTYNPEMDRLLLDENSSFTDVWSKAFKILNKGGMIILGSCYHQNEPTRKRQEDFYRLLGMQIITDAKDAFTASREGFWSQRLSLSLIKSYLKKSNCKRYRLINLDNYSFAFQAHLLK